FFFDYDNDGWPDIYVANGHIENEIERIQKRVKYAQPAHLFRNLGKGQFTEVSSGDLAVPRVGRGAAYADIDNDGDLDLLMTTNGGPAVLLRNDGGINKSLRIKLSGTRSNRDGIGAVVTVRAGNDVQSQMMRSGSSYLSASELVLTLGLAQHSQADEIKIAWPSGQIDELSKIAAGETVVVKEGTGIVQRRAYESKRPASAVARAKLN
ncbi:MAG TPA: CRTAC1 family protein, partial [Candidatus Acidoferrum sp.]|nr:CRTAC1 family protein [Candidatus Acidoferrum sp.]